jgi:hypothetical protein
MYLGSLPLDAAHLKNSQLANEVLFGQLGLDAADVGVLVEGERAELMTTLTDSGLQLGDRVKIRLWMDRQSQRVETRSLRADRGTDAAGGTRPCSEQVDPVSASQSDGELQGRRDGTQDSATLGPEHSAARRAQETKQEKGEAPAGGKGGLSFETVAIMATVLLGLAGVGPKRAYRSPYDKGSSSEPLGPVTHA